ncbi:MAG: hypothetical protein ACRCYP_06580 [Alphaproteobacteria bacterium]
MLPILKIHASLIFFLSLVSGAAAEMYGTYLNLSGYRVVLEELSNGNKQTTLNTGGKAKTRKKLGEQINHRLTLYKENEKDPFKILMITDQKQNCARNMLARFFNHQHLISLTDVTPKKEQKPFQKIQEVQKDWSKHECIAGPDLTFLGFDVEIKNDDVTLQQGVSKLF